MSQHDQNIADQTGVSFLVDINNLIGAIFTNSSGATEPTVMSAYQFWADTTTNLLKIRNGANSAWITIGNLNDTDLGLTKKTSSTGSSVLPSGTTAQRDGSPATGYLRFNTSYLKGEIYNGSSWTGLGGATGGSGDAVFYENGQTVNYDYTLSANTNAMSAGDITIATGATVTIPTGATWSIV